MSDACCAPLPPARTPSHRDRVVLWIALLVNAAMFVVELAAGTQAGSSSLRADAVDFLADAANYAVSLFVVAAGTRPRAIAAMLKGSSMGLLGVGVLAITALQIVRGEVPRAEVMGVVGVLALVANLAVLLLLVRFRRGDANMRSVWICSRNDAIGNVAVVLAASGVFATRSWWPDALVAVGMSLLAIQGAAQIVAAARRELTPAATTSPAQPVLLRRRASPG